MRALEIRLFIRGALEIIAVAGRGMVLLLLLDVCEFQSQPIYVTLCIYVCIYIYIVPPAYLSLCWLESVISTLPGGGGKQIYIYIYIYVYTCI